MTTTSCFQDDGHGHGGRRSDRRCSYAATSDRRSMLHLQSLKWSFLSTVPDPQYIRSCLSDYYEYKSVINDWLLIDDKKYTSQSKCIT